MGDGLMVTGRSEDGLVEAIERIDADQRRARAPWMLGVQWHPEETAEQDPAQQALFDELVRLARERPAGAAVDATSGVTRPA